MHQRRHALLSPAVLRALAYAYAIGVTLPRSASSLPMCGKPSTGWPTAYPLIIISIVTVLIILQYSGRSSNIFNFLSKGYC